MAEQGKKIPDGSVITLSRFRADLSKSLQRRGRKLLEATDAPAQMAALPPLEAYYVIKELGVDEAIPLLAHATGEQWQACVDLDCWENDTFTAVELDAWLAPFAHESKESLAEAFAGLDEEVQVLFLQQLMQVYDVRAEEAPEPGPDTLTLQTADGFFMLHAIPDRDREVEPFALVDALYRHDAQSAVTLLMAAKWELRSELEEQALRFRNGRLADLGFPPVEVANRLFAPPPKAPPALLLPPPTTHLPALYAAALHEGSLFSQALGEIQDPAVLERLESDWVLAVNAALIAYGESPRDLQHSAAVAGRVRDMVSLGLEALLEQQHSPISATTAAAQLAQWPLVHLFQYGHQRLLPLQRAAAALAADPVVAAWLHLRIAPEDDPEAADRAFLAALTNPRPLWGGSDPLRPGVTRAFGSLADLEGAERRLQQLRERLV